MKTLGSDGRPAYGRAQPAELIGWVLALDERELLDPQDRARLDRELRARLPESPTAGPGFLRRWLAEAPTEALRARISRVGTSLSLLRWLLIVTGLFFGWAAAAALLQVEVHAGRINIVLCLGLLVVVPLALLVLGCLGSLWSGRNARGGAGSRGTGAGIDAGWRGFALSRLALRLLPGAVRQDVEIILGRLTAHARLYSGVQRAQLFVWSQSMGLAFATGVLLATLSFVVFTDLAFGWSTTLDVDAARVHRLVEFVSAPWAWVWPEASPPLDLVETTRHFRVSEQPHIHVVDPIRYGGWWPFLVAAVAFYGVLPRLVAVLIGWGWLGRAAGKAIDRTPGVDALWTRLTTPFVETHAMGPEGDVGRAERGQVALVDAEDWIRDRGGENPLAIRWAEASDDEALIRLLDTPALQVRDAGGRRTLGEDADLIAAAAAGQGGIALCVRAYEPPVLDVLDFLADLRREVGPERGVCVMLLGGCAADQAAWRHKLMGLGDPELCVAGLDSAEFGTRDGARREAAPHE